MPVKYVHTNIIATDWKALATFYQIVFGCEPLLPERDQQGKWLDEGTGLQNAHLKGVHLRLPGYHEGGPTLEIYQYDAMLPGHSPAANRKGFGHIAFAVDDVEEVMKKAIGAGAKKVGKPTRHLVDGVGNLTFVYLADPEGNLIEIQRWD